ncbi:MAG TPA: STAS/SEC14 domain-containing protein [Polyangiaceae bacterium]|nr:STAS/SEC14 domain-containing protein [Polyangiaceae bacterium]
MANQSMTFSWISDDLLIVVDHRETLADEDFDAFLLALAERNVPAPGVRILVSSFGGGPTAAQRARFERQLRGKPIRVAVLCSAPFTRMIIKAFHLLGFLQVAPFAPDEEESAFRHLGLKAPEMARAREEIAKMRGTPKRQSAAGA